MINNGISSGYFNLGRGTRQGDPLSPYFILVLEILFIQIRADNIKGFKIDNIDILLSAFANDTTFIKEDVHSVNRMLKHETVRSLFIFKAKCGQVRSVLDRNVEREDRQTFEM